MISRLQMASTVGFFGLLLAGMVAAWFIADDVAESAASRDVPDGWVAPQRSGVATRYANGRWAEEYRFDDQDRRVEWIHDDSDGNRHVHRFNPETGEELSHEVILNPPPIPSRPVKE